MVKNPPAIRNTWVSSLGQEDPLEDSMATNSSILAWRIPWTEEPGKLQSMGSQRVGHDWATYDYDYDISFIKRNKLRCKTMKFWKKYQICKKKKEKKKERLRILRNNFLRAQCLRILSKKTSCAYIILQSPCLCVFHSVVSDSLRPHGL